MPPRRARIGTLGTSIATLDTRVVRPPPKVAESFYGSTAWQAVREAVIRERGARCEDCGAIGVKLYVDHIDERGDGGAELDKRNLRIRCSPCHARKTRAEQQRRMGG